MVTHQLQVERRTGKVRRPETDVLPLSHATNSGLLSGRIFCKCDAEATLPTTLGSVSGSPGGGTAIIADAGRRRKAGRGIEQ